MAYLIPETATRLTATAFVSDAELVRVDRSEVIRAAATRLAESALRRIMQDCITAEDYRGFSGNTLRLDVYVLSPTELEAMLADARNQGAKDRADWRFDR